MFPFWSKKSFGCCIVFDASLIQKLAKEWINIELRLQLLDFFLIVGCIFPVFGQ
jgi:hypothetical protein